MSAASPTVPRWVSAVFGALSLLGLVAILLMVILGFETPNTVLLVVSASLIFAAPLATLWHFATTRVLTPAEKRIWIGELTGSEMFSALSEYMRSTDLRASTKKLSVNAAARRAAKNRA
jgi:hypothetical protein